jgi:hypothetical protein
VDRQLGEGNHQRQAAWVHQEILDQAAACRGMGTAVHRRHLEEGREDHLAEGTASHRVAAWANHLDQEMGEDHHDRDLLGPVVL